MLKAIAISALVAGVVGFGSGVWVRDAFCDAAAANAKVKALETQLEAAQSASKIDQENAAAAQEEQQKLEGAIRELESKLGGGQCIDDRASDGVRGLWGR